MPYDVLKTSILNKILIHIKLNLNHIFNIILFINHNKILQIFISW